MTFDPTLPTDTDLVRSYLSDTTDPFTFSDREIEVALATQANAFRAAAFLATLEAQRVGGTVQSESLGDHSYTNRTAAEWQQIAASLWMRGAGEETPYVGGISRTDKAAQREDEDANLGTFHRGQFRNRSLG